MLTILGQDAGRFCDGLSRRSFLKIGSLGLAGMALPDLLRAEAAAGIRNSHKAVINVLLPGGPPHQDMFDLKPDAPADIRGEFKPINTKVTGIQICELMPRLAAMMDKFVLIRSMADSQPQHDLYQCVTGYARELKNGPAGGRPSIGAWISRLAGPADRAVPPHLSLMYPTGERRWGDPGEGGFLGMGHGPFRLVSGKDDKHTIQSAQNMVLQLPAEQLQDRDRLRKALDTFRIQGDASLAGVDEFTDQALGILTSSRLSEALDLSKEDPKVIERYGKADPKFMADGAPRVTTNFLLARRLVEAGARYVSLNFSRWDWHGNAFGRARQDLPMLDQALSALVQDLHDRGLARDVSVVCWGEFGRTPKINNKKGRDHWPKANFALLAGGGMRTGQVIGSTDKHAGAPKDRPVKFHEVFATLFHNLGLRLDAERVFDLRGRPQYPISPDARPLREVI
jgi:Protein of unknown function (DUF1501)